MNQVRPNDALQHRSRLEQQRFERRAGVMSVLLTAAVVIGLHTVWFGWQLQGTPATGGFMPALAARHQPVPGTASF